MGTNEVFGITLTVHRIPDPSTLREKGTLVYSEHRVKHLFQGRVGILSRPAPRISHDLYGSKEDLKTSDHAATVAIFYKPSIKEEYLVQADSVSALYLSPPKIVEVLPV